MFCAKCGKEIKENAKFCQSCGQKIYSSKNSTNIIIITIIAFLILGTFFIFNAIRNNNTVDTVKNSDSLIGNALNKEQNFTGSKVIVTIKSPSFFKPVNKKVMDAIQYKFAKNLCNAGHADAIIHQSANNKFAISIPNEFDKKEIEKLLSTKSMLEFKKHPNNNTNIWEPTGITGLDLKSSSVNKDYCIKLKSKA